MQTIRAGAEIHATDALRLIDELTEVVARACIVINSIAGDTIAHRLKPDHSPVTEADEAAEAAIISGLKRLTPAIPVVAEEMMSRMRPPELSGTFFLVDPLDGTKEFIKGSDEFTVNLALITQGTALAGIVAAPKQGKLWRGVVGHRAERLRLVAGKAIEPQPINTRRWPNEGATAAVSRSHLDAATKSFLSRLGPVARVSSGSAIKFCRLAEGFADVYPRLSPVCEWDLAAGHALLAAAGGTVTKPQGTPLTYGHSETNFLVPAFIAWGDPAKAAAFAEGR